MVVKYLSVYGSWVRINNPRIDNVYVLEKQAEHVAKSTGMPISYPFRWKMFSDPTPKQSPKKKDKDNENKPKYGEQLKFKL